MLDNYAVRLALFCLIGYGTVAEFFYVLWRLLCQLADLIEGE